MGISHPKIATLDWLINAIGVKRSQHCFIDRQNEGESNHPNLLYLNLYRIKDEPGVHILYYSHFIRLITLSAH